MIDNSSVREAQLAKLERLKAERSAEAANAALRALESAASSGEGNLLALAVDAARARCTVGEISEALERPWGRYVPSFSTGGGAYLDEYGQHADEIEQTIAKAVEFEKIFGRRPRVRRMLAAALHALFALGPAQFGTSIAHALSRKALIVHPFWWATDSSSKDGSGRP